MATRKIDIADKYARYRKYTDMWEAKGYKMSVVPFARFYTSYVETAAIMEYAGQGKENVVRRMAMLSREVTQKQAQQIRKDVFELTGYKLKNLKELKASEAATAFNDVVDKLAPGLLDKKALTEQEKETLKRAYRYTEAMFYPEKAEKRAQNKGKTQQEINFSRQQAKEEKQLAIKKYKEKRKI